ncbi:hypothetical protein E2C01_002376 [Portunus trituberculatus]|uniref:Uncharacterized protein n=1 Tax=Portunus trituberculatus TaxID=210409 RepID=A0A5B7CKE6_PORTR|nr:hypothetical protein [Portunus trituberculatus]
MSQPSVCTATASLAPEYIQFPSPATEEEVMQQFSNIAGMPVSYPHKLRPFISTKSRNTTTSGDNDHHHGSIYNVVIGNASLGIRPLDSSKHKQGPTPARHLTLNIPPKRPATSPAMSPKKKRKSFTLEVKLDIIHRHERGQKTNGIAHHHLDSIYCLYYFQVSRPYLPCKLKEPPEIKLLDSLYHPFTPIILSLVSPHSPSSNTIHSLPVFSTLASPNSLSTTYIISFLSLAYFTHSSITCSTISSSPESHI